MQLTRRKVLGGVGGAIGIGAGAWVLRSPSCDVACFDFYHEGFDDAPDWLTITHTDGRDLPAEEVFITNVVVEHGPDSEWVTDTVAWHEVHEDMDPSEGIAGRSIRIDIAFPDVVQVLWRHDTDEQVLDETQEFR